MSVGEANSTEAISGAGAMVVSDIGNAGDGDGRLFSISNAGETEAISGAEKTKAISNVDKAKKSEVRTVDAGG
ncbi:hypothetical protein FCV25MIE_34002 [Fagus crenata]